MFAAAYLFSGNDPQMLEEIVTPRPLVANPAAVANWLDLRAGLRTATDAERDHALGLWAKRMRRSIVSMIAEAAQGHIGGDLSATDILTTLFLAVLNTRPDDPSWPERDRLIMSKGHSSASLYSALAFSGFFPADRLAEYMAPLSPLNGHPNRQMVPGVETNTGSLGHGLPVGVGVAIGAKLQKRSLRVFVLTGDGELQEGSNWEALMSGARHGLDNLTLIVDRNRLQQGARTEETSSLEPLDAKLASFGWEVRVADGHSYGALLESLAPSTSGRPVAVIANTIKGRGVSFIEDRVEWHHKVPTPEQAQAALLELQ